MNKKIITISDLRIMDISNPQTLLAFQIQTAVALSDKSVELKVNDFFDQNKITTTFEEIEEILSESDMIFFKEVVQFINYERVINFERVVSFIIKCNHYGNNKLVEQLINKVFKKHTNFIENNIHIDNDSFVLNRMFVINSIFSYIDKNPSKGINSFSKASTPILIIYTAYIKGLTLKGTKYVIEHVRYCMSDLNLAYMYSIKNYNDLFLKSIDVEIKEYLKLFGLTNNKSYTFIEITDAITNKNIQLKEDYSERLEIYKKNLDEFDTNEVKLDDSTCSEKFGTIAKYIGINEGFMKGLNLLSLDELYDYKFSKKEMSILASNYFFAKKFNLIDDDNKYQLFISSLYTYVIANNYKKLKEKHIELSKLNDLERYNKLNNEIIKSKELLGELEWKKSRIEIKHEEEKESLKEEIIKLKKSLKNEANMVEEYEELKEEVVQLREYFFKNQNEDILDETILKIDYEQELSKYLEEYKIAFVGINNYLYDLLKIKYNDILIINDDRLNTDFSFMQNLEYVYISTKMSHSLYFKVMKYIKKYNLKFKYISDTQNIDIFLKNFHSDKI